MTQEPALHVTALAPLMAVQSTPLAFAHPPQLSMFDDVSTHSNENSRPGIGHLVSLESSQATSRRTRRAPPEAATVFAVAANNHHISKGEMQTVRGSHTRQLPLLDWLQDDTPLVFLAEHRADEVEPGADP